MSVAYVGIGYAGGAAALYMGKQGNAFATL